MATRSVTAAIVYAVLTGCAGAIPHGSYGVSSVEVEGTERFEADAIKACLATHARERAGFRFFGGGEPVCGAPPFRDVGTRLELWAWPWTDWPLLNEPAFERDLARVERWYRARGYYAAQVVDSDVERDPEEQEAHVRIEVEEGDPILIVRIDVDGLRALPPQLQRQVQDAIELAPGDPFDEALYDTSKARIVDVLAEASYAHARVEGQATLDPEQRIARIRLELHPGAPCRFGGVAVEGNEDLPARPIRGAAAIKRGDPYSLSTLKDAKRGIYALGAFASVELEPQIEPGSRVVNVLIRVVPGRRFRFGIGIGIESGGIHAQEGEEGVGDSFAQWDFHLLGKIEHRNFLGGLRRLRIEERPRLIFDDSFPSTQRAALGNLLTVEIRQPTFIDARTTLVSRSRWDRGPDPYGGRFLRHDLITGLGPERLFWDGRLRLSSTVNLNVFLPDRSDLLPQTELVYFQHNARLDHRDDPRNTRRGTYFTLRVQHAGYFVPSDWDYVRVTQDSRGYLPVFGRLVLAARARVGVMHITETAIEPIAPLSMEDPGFEANEVRRAFVDSLRELGPIHHRLRGGGHNSVRGYAPNTLGDAVRVGDGRLISGGLRQWEASVELRLPLTTNFGTVVFVDVGDVTRGTRFRLDHPQTSIGLGLRYRTLVGPLRLDAALAPKSLQVIGEDERLRTGIEESTLFGLGNGALHFTIGEAF